MRSNYKMLGTYVRPVDIRNSDGALGEDDLYGISVTKDFIETHANLVGVSFESYKIVSSMQFAYIPDTSRRGDKIAIALNTTGKTIIVSSICTVFEIVDKNQLLPEYLMLWFMRPEFDRYARFMSTGSTREVFDWDCMRGVELPVPTIDEQRKIVRDYQTITDRIALLQRINKNIESQYVLHFESKFGYLIPDGVNSLDIIPSGWTISVVGNHCRIKSSTFSKSCDEILYLDTGSITENYISELHRLNVHNDEIPSRARRSVSDGDIVYSTVRPNLQHYGLIYDPPENMVVSTGFAVIENNNVLGIENEYIYMWLTRNPVINLLHNIAENSKSTYPSINPSDLEKIKIIIPPPDLCVKSGLYFKSVFKAIDKNNKEIRRLKDALLSFFSLLLQKSIKE